MLTTLLHQVGCRSWRLDLAPFGGVWPGPGLRLRAKTVDRKEHGDSKRRALPVGFLPPILFLIGDALERHE